MNRGSIPFYLLALMLYVLAGTPLAPFHGDEATLIYSSRDYFDQFVAGDMARVMNQRDDDRADRDLRLLDGRVQKYLGGLAFHLAGGTAEQLNKPWLWGAPAGFSLANGHVPTHRLLMAERWAMAVLLALSVPAAYGVGTLLGRAPGGLLMATLVALSPNLVLNGRRAMMEAPLLLFSLLTVFAALKLPAVNPRSAVTAPRRSPWRPVLAFGVAAGLALASKHSAVLTVVPLFGALGVLALSRRSGREVAHLAAAGVLAIGTFLALNPAWWASPVEAARETLRLRSELMAMQTSVFGGYVDLSESGRGFVRFAILDTPQYFEVPGWEEIGPTIASYQSSPWVLPSAINTLRAVVVTILAALGVVALIRRGDSAAWVAGAWITGGLAATLVLTPLPWARYYLPALPPLLALASAGFGLAWPARPLKPLPEP